MRIPTSSTIQNPTKEEKLKNLLYNLVKNINIPNKNKDREISKKIFDTLNQGYVESLRQTNSDLASAYEQHPTNYGLKFLKFF